MSDSEEEKKKKKSRQLNRAVPKLGNRVVVIKNADKDKGNWMERWKPGTRNIGRIPHPFRLLALGGVGRGKTNTMKNIFLQHQSGNRKFKKLYICCCDVDSEVAGLGTDRHHGRAARHLPLRQGSEDVPHY